jgi:hypothetical protein
MPNGSNVVWIILGVLLIVCALVWLFANLGGDADAAVEQARAGLRLAGRDGPRFL